MTRVKCLGPEPSTPLGSDSVTGNGLLACVVESISDPCTNDDTTMYGFILYQ